MGRVAAKAWAGWRPRGALGLVVFALLAACDPASQAFLPVPPEQKAVALQRMRFLSEVACLDAATRRAQERVLDGQGFDDKVRTGNRVSYADPLSHIYAGLFDDNIDLTLDGASSQRRGRVCSIGSPVLTIDEANAALQTILAARLVSDADRLPQALGLGTAVAVGGNAYLFEGEVYFVGVSTVGFRDNDGGEFQLPVVSISVFRG